LSGLGEGFQRCRGQLSAEEVRMLMWQMLHGLKYLHALNVWHRDIKSSNVMLGRKEGHKMVKVKFRCWYSAEVSDSGAG